MGLLPAISIVIPTLNSMRTFRHCLESIRMQEYEGQVEIVVADGGSTDGTVYLAREYGALIVPNPLTTGEAGKAAGVRVASGDLVALVDSDNVLVGADWLHRLVAPFLVHEALVAAEPWEFTRRDEDPALVRYSAMLGMNDPLCHFIGNYDRLNVLTGRWTSLPVEERDEGDYVLASLTYEAMPTIGANGTLFRRAVLEEAARKDYLFDIDVLLELAAEQPIFVAKVKTGVVHLCGDGMQAFARKQRRRMRDYRYYRSLGIRRYPWANRRQWAGIARFLASTLTVVPLLVQAWRGYRRTRDRAWALHPFACWITLGMYAYEAIAGTVASRPFARTSWRQ